MEILNTKDMTDEQAAEEHLMRFWGSPRRLSPEQRVYRDNEKRGFLAGVAHERSKPRWVAVSERLPEESGSYLVAYSWGGVSTIEYSAKRKAWNAFDFEYENAEKHYMNDITHWQPLPPAPEEKK